MFQGTYIGALLKASVLTPNFWVGLIMTACLPASPAISTLELLTGRVVLVPFDGSTVVEGMVCPTTASSPDAEVRGILVAGLKKKNSSKSLNQREEVLDCKTTSYLPVASSLGGAATLPRDRPSTPGMPNLGISTWSRAELPVTPLPSRLLICTMKVRNQYCLYKISYEHASTWLTI